MFCNKCGKETEKNANCCQHCQNFDFSLRQNNYMQHQEIINLLCDDSGAVLIWGSLLSDFIDSKKKVKYEGVKQSDIMESSNSEESPILENMQLTRKNKKKQSHIHRIKILCTFSIFSVFLIFFGGIMGFGIAHFTDKKYDYSDKEIATDEIVENSTEFVAEASNAESSEKNAIEPSTYSEEKEKFQYSLDLENSDFFISAEIYEDASDEEQFSGLIDDAEYLEKVMDWFFERSDLPNSIQQLVSAENTGEWDAYNYESIESNENTTLTLNKSKYNLAYHFNAYTNGKQFVINSVSKEDKSGIGIAYCEKMSESVYDYFVVIYSNENMNAGYSFYLVKEKQFYPVSTESALACCTKTESEAGDEVDKINNISASEQHD